MDLFLRMTTHIWSSHSFPRMFFPFETIEFWIQRLSFVSVYYLKIWLFLNTSLSPRNPKSLRLKTHAGHDFSVTKHKHDSSFEIWDLWILHVLVSTNQFQKLAKPDTETFGQMLYLSLLKYIKVSIEFWYPYQIKE